MSASRAVSSSLLAWLAVGVAWYFLTRGYHPTRFLAIVVTSSLIAAYAGAAYLNHLVLLPRLWATGRRGLYAAALLAVMVLLTGSALAVIRTAYFTTHGPDPDPNGAYVHFAIDFFGMAVHLLAAGAVVWAVKRFGL